MCKIIQFKYTIVILTLTAVILTLSACAVKDGPLPTEVGEITTEPDLQKVLLLEDDQMTQEWEVFKDDIYGLYGFKDRNGAIVIEPKYLEAENFQGGRAIVKVASDKYMGILEGGVFGLIDPNDAFVVEPNGLLTRVDSWHYLYAEGDDYFAGYGVDETSIMKRTLLNAEGERLGDYRFYYVEALNDNCYLANIGTKSIFINAEGAALTEYPEFDFAATARLEGDTIVVMPLDDTSGRIQFTLSADGKTLEQKNETLTLTDGVTYELAVLSPYIGNTVIYPVLTMKDVSLQERLNQALQSIATDSIWALDITGEALDDYESLERIDMTVVNELNLFLNNDLLNVEAMGYFYGFGAAHPNSFQSTKYIDIRTGEVLTVESLFMDDLDWRMAIVKEIDRQFMADEDAYLFIDKAEPESDRLDAFYGAHFEMTFGPEAISVYFSVYEIAPYAAGIPTYEIPYEVLEGYFNRESAFFIAKSNK